MQKNISVNPPTTSSTNAYETFVVLLQNLVPVLFRD